MANSCRGCKREIAQSQKTCYLCGCSQSYFRYHLKSGIFVLALMGVFSSGSYWYIDKATKAAEIDKALISESNNEAANLKLQQVELEIGELKNKLVEIEATLVKANQENSQLKMKLEQATVKITEAENKAIETDKKAGWLLKLNRQLKEQVASLSAVQPAAEENSLEANESQPEAITP